MPDLRVTPTERCRITFATHRTLAYVSVLELGTIWERTLRRARIPVRYSQGFNPRPRLQFAAPLPVGCGGAAELMDFLMDEAWEAERIAAALEGKTPPDLHVLQVATVPEDEPALSEQLVAAEYRVGLREVDPGTVQAAARNFLAAEEVIVEKRGRRKGKTYDLRALVYELSVEEAPAPWVHLWMRVSALPGATGRPDVVLRALNLADVPRRCTRERLILGSDFG